MELKVRQKINNLTSIEASFEAKTLQDAVQDASALLAYDGKCGCCGSLEIITSATHLGGSFISCVVISVAWFNASSSGPGISSAASVRSMPVEKTPKAP